MLFACALSVGASALQAFIIASYGFSCSLSIADKPANSQLDALCQC